jgi:hypothetical protein
MRVHIARDELRRIRELTQTIKVVTEEREILKSGLRQPGASRAAVPASDGVPPGGCPRRSTAGRRGS